MDEFLKKVSFSLLNKKMTMGNNLEESEGKNYFDSAEMTVL